MEDTYVASHTVNPVENKDQIITYRSPLTFDLSDAKFLEYAKELKRNADEFWDQKGATGYDLKTRRSFIENYYWGRQLVNTKMKKYSSRAQDNILWEAQKYLRAMALSKLPDITVTPGNDTDNAKKIADLLSKIVTSDIQSRERKRVLGLAFDHIPVYLLGGIKPFWNPQKGRYGNYDFRVVHPENLTLDPRAATNDVRDMDFVFEAVEYTVKQLFAMFPEAKKDFIEELYKQGNFTTAEDGKTENNAAGLNSKIKIQEVWFKWYDQPKEAGKNEWEEIIGVGWYFHGCLFRKIKHPYWDWSGTPQLFTYELSPKGEKNKKFVDETQLRQSLISGQEIPGMQSETIFHNHLEYPEFPYIFMGMNQWGKTPIDETSGFEQAIPMQEEYDRRQRQITEMLDRSRGKHIFSSSEGLTKDDVANMDLADPNQDVLIKGDVSKVHEFIQGEMPSPALIQDAQMARERIFDKLGIHQSTRGQVDSDTTATNNQMAREGDFSRMDDAVDDTINYTAEKMANWEMQFMKLFYTENHFRRLLGPDGIWLTSQVQRDMLDDGMEVVISASGSDKLKAQQMAVDDAKMKLTDPFHYYKDTAHSDPKGRTLSLMNFLMQPQMYQQDIMGGGDGSAVNVNKAADNLAGQPADPNQPNGGTSPQAAQDIMSIQSGQVPAIPQQIDPAYATTFNAFMQSPEVEQLIQQYGDQFKQALLQFAQAITQMSNGQAQQQVGQPQQPPQSGMPGSTNQTVGPLAGAPSPQNTSRVAVVPGQ